jgi:hypothetical protein
LELLQTFGEINLKLKNWELEPKPHTRQYDAPFYIADVRSYGTRAAIKISGKLAMLSKLCKYLPLSVRRGGG